mgnify:CR=1 FL=1
MSFGAAPFLDPSYSDAFKAANTMARYYARGRKRARSAPSRFKRTYKRKAPKRKIYKRGNRKKKQDIIFVSTSHKLHQRHRKYKMHRHVPYGLPRGYKCKLRWVGTRTLDPGLNAAGEAFVATARFDPRNPREPLAIEGASSHQCHGWNELEARYGKYVVLRSKARMWYHNGATFQTIHYGKIGRASCRERV